LNSAIPVGDVSRFSNVCAACGCLAAAPMLAVERKALRSH
jgi:hypothetical protein